MLMTDSGRETARPASETYQSLLPCATTINFDRIPVRSLSLEGLLKTKQTSRDRDTLDRIILERALEELKKANQQWGTCHGGFHR